MKDDSYTWTLEKYSPSQPRVFGSGEAEAYAEAYTNWIAGGKHGNFVPPPRASNED
jgi:hypothetical protein